MKKNLIFSCILATLCSFFYFKALSLPMWSFKLQAPQYPQGLVLNVHLTGATGDVFEIDIINHYIGMQKLGEAAKDERMLAPYVLIALAICVFLAAIVKSKKRAFVFALPVVVFPVAFVTIFYMWLYKFGHDLNPTAPVKLVAFTPTILGEGIIGQFTTVAFPAMGFYLSCLCSVIVIIIIKIKNIKLIKK